MPRSTNTSPGETPMEPAFPRASAPFSASSSCSPGMRGGRWRTMSQRSGPTGRTSRSRSASTLRRSSPSSTAWPTPSASRTRTTSLHRRRERAVLPARRGEQEEATLASESSAALVRVPTLSPWALGSVARVPAPFPHRCKSRVCPGCLARRMLATTSPGGGSIVYHRGTLREDRALGRSSEDRPEMREAPPGAGSVDEEEP
jgi:hypothetical protein